ncbi:hypothetical protein HXX76_005592 [Chlamydomonas incerta]|uniref:Disease resistance R13L4/SHOC-2-like LRR domain-containing protein n=1 Tax=Chlamydomonas incerta TaxID=51695 RepID=A0A835T379_CHLIN|nr:hypothetical protein HXX76_005592 [Chlamydomonas incerta]|eukprot:KAG2437978.1 hypothetical protein HXX76_005592 [Chlamydomonas incerta]
MPGFFSSCFGSAAPEQDASKEARTPQPQGLSGRATAAAPTGHTVPGRPSAADSVMSTRTSVASDGHIHPPHMSAMDTVRSSALFEPAHPINSVTSHRYSGGHSRPASAAQAKMSSDQPPAAVTQAYKSQNGPRATLWTLPCGPFQRLNVVDGSPVNQEYIDGLRPLNGGGEVDSELLEPKDRLWRQVHGVKLSLCDVTQYVGLVRHHLRGGDQHSHHHEIWRMFLVVAPNNEGSWLWPVGRESDFEDMTTLDLNMIRFTVWKEGISWLDLSNTNLTELPPDLHTMTSLTRLELQGNRLTSIPDAITALTNLDYLSCHSNSIQTVTTKLTELSKLRWLSLNANELTVVPNVPTSVERLSLHMNQIAGLAYCEANGGTGELPTEDNGDGGPLARCKNLFVVSLFTNKIPYIPRSTISVWTRMDRLSLQRNQLTEVPEEICHMAALEHLWLYGNKLTKLPDSLGQLKKLSKLWVNNNQLTSLPESLGACESLEELYLANNKLTSLPCEALMAGCKRLAKIQITGNEGLDRSKMPQEIQDVLL